MHPAFFSYFERRRGAFDVHVNRFERTIDQSARAQNAGEMEYKS